VPPSKGKGGGNRGGETFHGVPSEGGGEKRGEEGISLSVGKGKGVSGGGKGRPKRRKKRKKEELILPEREKKGNKKKCKRNSPEEKKKKKKRAGEGFISTPAKERKVPKSISPWPGGKGKREERLPLSCRGGGKRRGGGGKRPEEKGALQTFVSSKGKRGKGGKTISSM